MTSPCSRPEASGFGWNGHVFALPTSRAETIFHPLPLQSDDLARLVVRQSYIEEMYYLPVRKGAETSLVYHMMPIVQLGNHEVDARVLIVCDEG